MEDRIEKQKIVLKEQEEKYKITEKLLFEYEEEVDEDPTGVEESEKNNSEDGEEEERNLIESGKEEIEDSKKSEISEKSDSVKSKKKDGGRTITIHYSKTREKNKDVRIFFIIFFRTVVKLMKRKKLKRLLNLIMKTLRIRKKVNQKLMIWIFHNLLLRKILEIKI